MGVIIIWLVKSSIAIRRALKAHSLSQNEIKTTTHAPSARESTTGNGSPPGTPQRRRTTQALADNEESDSPSEIGAHVPFGIGKTVHGRTGRVSTPGYQTPTPYFDNASQKKFSDLSKKAPTNYQTLRQNGWLDAAGTPTKKATAILGMRNNAVTDDDEYVQVFGSPTRSYGRVKKSKLTSKEV